MRFLTTLLLAFATAALGAWLYLDPSHRPASAPATLLPLTADRVVELRIERGEEEVVLVRDGDFWIIREPRAARADQERVTALLEKALGSPILRELEGSATDHAKYGLSPPQARLDFRTDEGAVHRLDLGRETPLGGNAYARTEHAGFVLVSRDLPFAANRGFDDLRNRKALPPHRKPDEIRMRRPGLPDTLLVRSEATWKIVDPFLAEADNEVVAEFLRRLDRLRAEAFLDDATEADLDAYSFHPPPLEIELGYPQPTEGDGLRIAIGGPNLRAATPQVWLRIDNLPTLLSVNKPDVIPLDLSPDALRDKRLLKANAREIDAFTIERAGVDPLRLVRGETGWTVAGAPADAGTIRRYLDDALGLRGEQTLSTAGGAEHFGLATPSLRIVFEATPADSPRALRLHETEDSRFVAAAEGSGIIYSIGPHAFARLDKTRKDFE
ncbi:MAG: DUF4340 domain-containing protein [bacterium]